ncbi:MAG: helix-turn-helix transcriptional regulator, partial [Sphingobacterium siyangense]
CTKMHPIILGVLIIEFILIGAVGLYCLERPSAKDRKGYFIFLAMLVLLNIANGLIPNPDLKIPLAFQYFLRNTIGFITISYLPYLYFKKLNITSINKKAKKVWDNRFLFIAPYPMLFAIIYSTSNDLEVAHRLSLFVPCLNNMSLVAIAGKNIKDISEKKDDSGRITMDLFAFGTILSWLFIYPLIHLNGGKELETILINLGPTSINLVLLHNWLKNKRLENETLQNPVSLAPSLNLITVNCQNYSLSERETEVVILLCHHFKRQQIADKLFISIRTVDKHIERIFLKTGVSSRDSLFEKLNTMT